MEKHETVVKNRQISINKTSKANLNDGLIDVIISGGNQPYNVFWNPNNYNRLVSFKKMVISIFTKSEKIRSLDVNRKKYLGACITHSISIEQLKELTINLLSNDQLKLKKLLKM